LDVSIIIVNWNTKELLGNCLNSIYEQAGDVDYEVIVVDNASSDGSVEMLKKEFPDVCIIENTENRGFAVANNQAIKIAKGRYILLLNSDTIICDSAIEKTVRYADRHPEAAAVGCQVRESPDKIQMTCFRYPSLLTVFLRASGLAALFKYNRFFGQEETLSWGRDTEREVDIVSGMFMLVRHEAIRQVGLMDETYFLYFEDTDWCYRFFKAGWKMLFWPGARVVHIGAGSKSTDQDGLRMFVQFQKSLLIFFKKHYGNLSYFVARLMLSVSFGLRSFCWASVALFKRTLGSEVNYEVDKTKKSWCAFRFCALGQE
jgi:GT2 family glycosyltransferase